MGFKWPVCYEYEKVCVGSRSGGLLDELIILNEP